MPGQGRASGRDLPQKKPSGLETGGLFLSFMLCSPAWGGRRLFYLESLLNPHGVLELQRRIELQLFLTAIVEILFELEVHFDGDIDIHFGQELPQVAFGLGGESDGITENAQAFRRIVESDGIFRPHEQLTVKGLFIKVFRLGVELFVDLLSGFFGLVDDFKQLGGGGRGIARAVHEGNCPILDGEDALLQPVGAFGMALLAGLHVSLDGAHDTVIGNLLDSDDTVGHVAVRTRSTGLVVHAVVGPELEFGVSDKGQLETGDVLLPFLDRLVASNLVNDVFDGDVPPFAFLPGEVKADGLAFGILWNGVGDVALSADGGAHLLARKLFFSPSLIFLSP